MAETVNVPGAGPVKKTWVYGGLAVLAAILAVAYYRHAKNQAAAPAGDQTGADTGAADMTAAADTTAAGQGSIIGYDSAGNPIYSSQTGYGPVATAFATNSQWAQAAEDYLVNTVGADPAAVSAALGAYLNGNKLSEAQATIINSAVAFEGRPPQAGLNGYPPALRLAAPPGTPPAPHTTYAANPVGNLHVISNPGWEIHVGWAAAKNARYYVVNVFQAGRLQKKWTVASTNAVFNVPAPWQRHKGTTYHVYVTAEPAAPAHTAANINVTTPR